MKNNKKPQGDFYDSHYIRSGVNQMPIFPAGDSALVTTNMI